MPKCTVTFSGVLEFAYVMNQAQRLKTNSPPKTAKAAVKRLIKGLSLKDKTTIAYMAETELSTLHLMS